MIHLTEAKPSVMGRVEDVDTPFDPSQVCFSASKRSRVDHVEIRRGKASNGDTRAQASSVDVSVGDISLSRHHLAQLTVFSRLAPQCQNSAGQVSSEEDSKIFERQLGCCAKACRHLGSAAS